MSLALAGSACLRREAFEKEAAFCSMIGTASPPAQLIAAGLLFGALPPASQSHLAPVA